MPDESNGHVENLDGNGVLRFVRRYAAPRTEVWSAITEPERLGRWAYPGTIELRVGGAVVFDYGEQGEGRGTVLACDEPSLLEYEWGEGDERWRIRFELVADGDGTVLTFDHFLPDPTQPQFAAGWHWHLGRLADEIAGEQTPDLQSEERFVALMEMYTTR
jgi:uncharacterized protein YndB with AHSA1/START domain